MHCPSCPRVIKMDLEEAPGVTSVIASLDTKSVIVEYDPSIQTPQSLIGIIKTSGYTAIIPNA